MIIKPMYFTPNNFTLALTFLTASQDAIINLHSYLNITVKNCQILRFVDSNGELNITQNCFDYPIESCSMENHFPTDAQKTMFTSQNLSNLYCLQNNVWKNRSVVLQGTYAVDNYQSLTIIASLCQNTTQSRKCAPQSQIEQTLKLIFYGYYYNDALLQQDSVSQPLQTLIRFLETPVSYGQTKSLLHENQIYTGIYILNKLDVSYILTKLIEIDKLKQILLTKDQRYLFNHLPKPNIPKALFNASTRIAIEDNPKYEIILQEEKSDLMKLQEAFGAYRNITINSELDQDPIDLKLLNQLDTDIYNLFKQIDQEGSDLPSSSPFKKSLLSSFDASNNHQVLQSDIRRRNVLSQSEADSEEQAQIPK